MVVVLVIVPVEVATLLTRKPGTWSDIQVLVFTLLPAASVSASYVLQSRLLPATVTVSDPVLALAFGTEAEAGPPAGAEPASGISVRVLVVLPITVVSISSTALSAVSSARVCLTWVLVSVLWPII